MDGGGGHNGYNSGYDMPPNPVVNGGTPAMPTPPPAHEQQHYSGGRGRGGRPRGGHGQSFNHHQQQYSQQYNPQYTSQQWAQPQAQFYPHQNGAYNHYVPPYNPYTNNTAYYNQGYNAAQYYPQGTAYHNYNISPQYQQPQMYGAQAHQSQSPYQQPQFVTVPQQPITNGPNSPFSQNPVPTGQAAGASHVPLTPASAQSSQAVSAPSIEPIQVPAVGQSVDTQMQPAQDEQNFNSNDIVETAPSQQSATSSPIEVSLPTFSTPRPNPQFSFSHVPFYTDPDSKHIFAARKRARRSRRPIDGHEMTMQASQPAQTEAPAIEPKTDDAVVVGDVEGSASTTETMKSTDSVASGASAAIGAEPIAEAPKAAHDSSAAELTRPGNEESPQPPPPAPTTNTATVESAQELGTNGVSENAGVESAAPVAKLETAPKPKTWAHLLKKDPVVSKPAADTKGINGNGETQNAGATGLSQSISRALGEVLRNCDPTNGKVVFIEPRGLQNANVDCYMISILQALLSLTPFHRFLRLVKTQSDQSLKSDTPLLDALVDFQDNFRIIKSADSPKQLRENLTPEQHRQYGESLSATSIFDAIFRIPQFKTLERGKQQDAQEFLNLLLDELAEECVNTIGVAAGKSSSLASASTDGAANDWKTVEKNGKPAVTLSTGLPQRPNPVSKIFMGKFRQEVRSKKDVSNQDAAFTNLQLHIDDQDVNSIFDALIRWNAAQNTGDKDSQSAAPSKYLQPFIHKLPHILIIHLVRFQHNGGKSWRKNGKHVDFPLELEIPATVLSKPARIEYAESRKYRLVSVVYHHGLNVNSGHYTVDVRRQDDESWLRINDHRITPIDSSDVVGPDKNVSARPGPGAASKGTSSDGVSSNRFAAMGDNTEGGPWQNVGASGSAGKKSSNVGNGKTSGTSTPKGTPTEDNKVAYLFFYQKLN